MSLTATMDCVVIDRVSYERMKDELDQLAQRNQELTKDNELLRTELELVTKLNSALEQLKANLDKWAALVRDRFDVGHTPFDRDVAVWQSEYSRAKTAVAEWAKHQTSDGQTATEIVLTASGDQIWTVSEANGGQPSDVNYLCAEEDVDQTLTSCELNSDSTTVAVKKSTKTRLKSKAKGVAVSGSDGQKRFVCSWPECAYATNNRGNFQKHYRIHTGEKPYKCQHEGCVYSCSDPARFREHKQIHSSEKAYGCEWPGCSWRFKTYKLLKNHVKACHTGDKPHRCEWPGCEKHFLNKYEVRDHMRQHTGDRPFKCEYPDCSGAFARSNTLTQHIREVHYYKKQYFCDYNDCDSRFDKVCELKDHIRDRHCRADTGV